MPTPTKTAAEPIAPRPLAVRRKPGRPSTLTPELLARIEEAALAGLKDAEIYALLSIPKQTWARWQADPEFRDALACARAKMVHAALVAIRDGAKSWQALAWLVALHFPDSYPRPGSDTAVNVNTSATATATAGISDAELHEIQARRQLYLEKLAREQP